MSLIYWLVFPVIALGAIYFFGLRRVINCPSNRLLITYNRFERWFKDEYEVEVYQGGMVYVWPIIQGYQMLDLTPLKIEVDLADQTPDEYSLTDPTVYYLKAGLLVDSSGNRETVVNLFQEYDRQEIKNWVREQVEDITSNAILEYDNDFFNEERNLFLLKWEERLQKTLPESGIELLTISHKP
ncbi:MAG: SPFH domain-containing protein [bacterium]